MAIFISGISLFIVLFWYIGLLALTKRIEKLEHEERMRKTYGR